ncbi:MAG: hypothetical protein Q9220_001210 [cf. Caloplaca sp. 1 TL-2023]
MSGSAEGSNSTTKAVTSEPPSSTTLKDDFQKPAAALEEDDEFEDFPVEAMGLWTNEDALDWPAEDQEVPQASEGGAATSHLWEESWDDDDTSEDFSKQLK